MLKKTWFLAILVCILGTGIFFNIPIEKRKYGLSQTNLTTDYTGLLPEKIDRVVTADNSAALQQIVKQANVEGQHISIAGLQHSQGGHTYYKNGIVLDMKTFNEVLEVNVQEKTVRVESGATWEDVQEAIQEYGLALKVTQSQSIFTVGGSLSINAHGRDIRFGPMAGTVKAMTLLTPNGDIQTLTHEQNKEQLANVLGGYGLFGVILDVTLELTENDLYAIQTEALKTTEYETYFNHVLDDPTIAMHYARVSVAPGSFLQEMYAINYLETGKQDTETPLKGEQGMRLSKLALDLGRQGGPLEDLFWTTQKRYIHSLDGETITRNNVMRSESTFMEFKKPGKVEVLQEFFVPVDAYADYMKDLGKLLSAKDKNEDFKVHNITVRYVEKDDVTTLNYAREDMLGLVILIQHGLNKKDIENAQNIIQQWTDLTLAHAGTYYLPYYRYQTTEQFQKSYPNWKTFKQDKLAEDPNEVFVNLFYDNYLSEEAAYEQ
ncbi:FAD-binding oxidoreductase [Solibacillus sp. FSL H8-0538]|uniref:FAD-binding oxidoreductase n=1 Tax=Solibacillus sp. FSL H8-0538 TaxID=2921400 RepID=UPI0030F96E4B